MNKYARIFAIAAGVSLLGAKLWAQQPEPQAQPPAQPRGRSANCGAGTGGSHGLAESPQRVAF